MREIKIFSTTFFIFLLLFVFSPVSTSADTLPCSEYTLTAIVGSYAWGCTDWNAVSTLGYVNNVSDLGTVEALLCDGYEFQPDECSVTNGIYNWETPGLHALEFAFNGGTNYTLNTLSFISSRSYEDGTPISIEYAVDGGSWIEAASTTSGALGIITGDANTYTINLGGVIADRFRYIINGGEQVSIHEIIIDVEEEGEVESIPTINEWGIIIMSLILAGSALWMIRRRQML